MNDGPGRIDTVYAFAKGSFDHGSVDDPKYVPPKRPRWHPDSFLLPAAIGAVVAVVSLLAALWSFDVQCSRLSITWLVIAILAACMTIISLFMASQPAKDDA